MSGKYDHFKHRLRMCDRYFPNSLRPISYLRNICDLYMFRPDKKFRKNNQISWTRDSQCQNSADRSAKNTPNAQKFISLICLRKNKSVVYH